MGLFCAPEYKRGKFLGAYVGDRISTENRGARSEQKMQTTERRREVNDGGERNAAMKVAAAHPLHYDARNLSEFAETRRQDLCIESAGAITVAARKLNKEFAVKEAVREAGKRREDGEKWSRRASST